MAEISKVIKGLKCCGHSEYLDPDDCEKCPYVDGDCLQMFKDAIALLKEHPEGQWITANPDGIVSYSNGYAECSVCHKKSWLGWHDEYCRHCGAKMKGEKNES